MAPSPEPPFEIGSVSLATYDLAFTDDCMSSLRRLPSSSKSRVRRVLMCLGRNVDEHPERVVRRGKGFIYRHQEPLVEITFCINSSERTLLATLTSVSLTKRVLIFVSYSHDDRKDLRILKKFLSGLETHGNVREWDDSRIGSGDDWRVAIDEALAGSSIAVLLVTQSFLASPFIKNVELPELMKQWENGRMDVNWIPMRPCTVHHTRLAEIQALIDPKKTLHQMRLVEREQVLVDIHDKLKQVCERLMPPVTSS